MYWWLNYLLQFSSFNYWKSALNFLWAKHFMKTWVWIWHSWKELKSQMESSPRHTSVESKSNVHFTVHWEEKKSQKRWFLLQIWYFVTINFLSYCEKKKFYWSRKTFEIQGWRPRICKICEVARTIHSNVLRWEQLLVAECFYTCSWGSLISNELKQLEFKLEKNIGI